VFHSAFGAPGTNIQIFEDDEDQQFLHGLAAKNYMRSDNDQE
jgi:hypothetical protein